jgi:diguanylate cyclase (GGDEF)-like protein/PAS domain S-box-containing protein
MEGVGSDGTDHQKISSHSGWPWATSMTLSAKNWLGRIVGAGLLATDNAELRLEKTVMTLVPLIIGPFALIWGTVYFVLGHWLSGAIPMSYTLISAASLSRFFKTKDVRFVHHSQLILVLLLPFFLMWSLGGFSAGSMVMIWAIFSPVAALMFLEKREAFKWFMMYSMLILISALIDDQLAAKVAPLPGLEIKIFYLLNMGFGSAGLYLLVSYSMGEEKRANEASLRMAAVSFESQQSLMILDADGVIMKVNRAFTQDTGYAPDDVVGKTPLLFRCGRHDASFYRDMLTGLMRTGAWQGEIWFRNKQGDDREKWLSVSAIRGDDGLVSHYACAHVDISERKEVERKNEVLLLRQKVLMSSTLEGVHIMDIDGNIVECNEAFCQMLGYSPEDARNLNVSDWDAQWSRKELMERFKALVHVNSARFETRHRRSDGTLFDVEVSTTGAEIDGRRYLFASSYDITRRKEAEETIRQLAFHDSLTHLPNRQLLLDRLNHALASSDRNGSGGAILFIDLDNFKTLNDTLGHVMGDLLLQQVAERLVACVREGDTVARLGGDEFVVMLENLSDQAINAAEEVEVVGVKILAALSQPYQLKQQIFRSSGSLGATLFCKDSKGAEELLKQADIAMYQAKKAGRNTLRFFDQQMQAAIHARAEMEEQLRMALENGQFELYYQVQVDREGLPMGAEALIRWHHPQRGIVIPAEFISLAEETGLILPIGCWVLEEACAKLAGWSNNERMQRLVLAVNISARQFRQTDFVDGLKALIAKYALDPSRLKLELTESMLLESSASIRMNGLKEIGVQLSLDDFGTGYSSLQYLKHLPLDQIKIDQSFIRDIATASSDAAIVRTIIAMTEALRLDVIAEGVETEAQRALLESGSCPAYQGYLFGEPLPAERFEALFGAG